MDTRILCLTANLHDFCVEYNSGNFNFYVSGEEREEIFIEENKSFQECKNDFLRYHRREKITLNEEERIEIRDMEEE